MERDQAFQELHLRRANQARPVTQPRRGRAFQLNLDIFWVKDESLEDSANLANPDVIAQEIVEDLQAALAQFAEIANDLKR